METQRRDRFHSKHIFKMSKIKKKKNKCKPSHKKWNKISSNFKTEPVASSHSKDFHRRPSSSDDAGSSEHESEVFRSNSPLPIHRRQDAEHKFWPTERSYQTEATTSNAYAGVQSRSRRAIRQREETESSDDDSNTSKENQNYYRATSLDKNSDQAIRAQIIKEKLGDGVGAFSDVFSVQSEDGSEDSSDEHEQELIDLRNSEMVNQQQYERPETPDMVEIMSEEEVAEPPLNENDYQILKDRNFSILVLGKYAEVALVGMAMVKVVSGQAQILGFTLTPSAKNFVPVYSLKLQSHLTVRALPASSVPRKQINENLIKKLENELVSGRIIKYIAETTDQNSTVVLFKPIASKVSVKYAFYLSNYKFGAIVDESVKLNDVAYKKLVDTNYSIVPTADVKHLNMEKISPILDEIENNLGYSISHGTPPPRIMLCGPKNAGKSTILRYLVNFILPNCPKIIYLDADPGQGEFTSCGTISLSPVEDPLLGPPFTHQKTPEAMVYVGGKTVSNTPDAYSAGIWDLMVHYRKFFGHLPLFINTMGWTNTPGRNLLIDVMRYTEPTFIIQLNLEQPSSQNLPNLTPSFVNEEIGWKTNPGEFNLGYELRILSLNSDEFPHIKSITNFTGKTFRELALYSYFGRLQGKSSVDNYDPINSFKPYKIPFKSIGVFFCNETPPYEFVLDALNVTLVALCHLEKDQFTQDARFPHYPKRVTSMEGNVQLGYGIVRGINRKEETILIVTPEPLSRLQSVNALVVGYDDFPTKFLTSQKVQGFIPYVSKRDDQSSALSQGAKRKRSKSAINSQEWKSPILV